MYLILLVKNFCFFSGKYTANLRGKNALPDAASYLQTDQRWITFVFQFKTEAKINISESDLKI